MDTQEKLKALILLKLADDDITGRIHDFFGGAAGLQVTRLETGEGTVTAEIAAEGKDAQDRKTRILFERTFGLAELEGLERELERAPETSKEEFLRRLDS